MKKWQLPFATAVDLWAVDLDAEETAVYEPILVEDELARASRFHFDRDRQRYIVGRGRLRLLLGQYLGLLPEQVRLAYSEHGKPYLPPQPAQPVLHFNVTHSQQFALLAFAWGRRLGVDIEVIRPLTNMAAMVRRFFAPAEVAAWEAISPDRQVEAFYCGWTRKEAFIKAIGDGLSYPLDQFVVNLHPDESAQLLSVAGSIAAAEKWEMVAIRPFSHTVAALIVAKESAPFGFPA
jgi:4'-phosphopantetheinyl transferase